jgi:hypothetical protein
MVDSHVLVGSCAQIGARVHLSAGVQIGGVLEPAGRRPVIVEDEVFVGAQAALLEGVLVKKGAVIAAGVILTGTSRLYDLVRERVIVGTLDEPLVVPAGAVVAPGVRGRWPASSPPLTAGPLGRDRRQVPRRAHRRPGRPRGGAAVTAGAGSGSGSGAIGRLAIGLRRGLRLGGHLGLCLGLRNRRHPRRRAGWPALARGPGRGIRDALLRLRPGPDRPARRGVAGGPAARLPDRVRGQGQPRPGGGRASAALRRRRRRGVRRRAGDGPASRLRTRGDRHDRPRQARRRAGRGRRRRHRLHHRRVAGRAAPPRGDRRAAGRRQPILLRLAVSEDARLETVRLIGGVEGKFGMPLETLIETARAAAASPHVELLGIHAFGASNLRDAEQLVGHVADLVEIGRQMAAEAGTRLRVVDAGGGLGIPYSDGETPLDLERLGRRLASCAADGTRTANSARWSSSWSRAGSWSDRPARTWPGSWTSRVPTRRPWRSWTAASTTFFGPPWSRASIASPS